VSTSRSIGIILHKDVSHIVHYHNSSVEDACL